MNAIQVLASQPWVERLGWTPIHFLWQGLLIALPYAAVRRAMARSSTPNARYLLAVAAMAAMMVAPLATWAWLAPATLPPGAAYRIQGAFPGATAASSSAALLETVAAVQPPQYLPWVVMFWMAGAVVFWMRLAGGWVVAARMRSVSVRPAPPDWQEALRRLGARIGLSRPVRLLVSAVVQVPSVVGCLRPVVLVPVGALAGLPAGELEALLLHELAHIRRHDYLANILQSVAEALLFYHPAIWWVSGHMRHERELCCDDLAVSASGDAFTYARALAQVEAYRPAHSGAALAASGGSLSARIARLLGRPRKEVRTSFGPGILAAAVLLAVAAYGLFGQPADRPAFSSVSVKLNASPWNQRSRRPMGLGVNSSLLLLIRFVYAPRDNPMNGHWAPLPASLVVGGPEWIDSEGYDIDAKPPAGTGPQQVWTMWQTLLADRFRLKLHRETRDLPVYNLTVAPGGLKLPAAKPAECVSFPPGTPPRHIPGKVDCGYVAGPFSGGAAGRMNIEGRKVHVSDLVRELASVLDRPVFDKTGFTGEFDLDLSYTAGNPNIFNALEQQLGLKLEPARASLEVLVVDHAERPVVD
jgi:uncharacterized protein (TIGR03435 family)